VGVGPRAAEGARSRGTRGIPGSRWTEEVARVVEEVSLGIGAVGRVEVVAHGSGRPRKVGAVARGSAAVASARGLGRWGSRRPAARRPRASAHSGSRAIRTRSGSARVRVVRTGSDPVRTTWPRADGGGRSRSRRPVPS